MHSKHVFMPKKKIHFIWLLVGSKSRKYGRTWSLRFIDPCTRQKQLWTCANTNGWSIKHVIPFILETTSYLSSENTCLERPLFCGLTGGLWWQTLLNTQMLDMNVTPVSIINILRGESLSTSVRSTGLQRLNRSRRRLISDGLICDGLRPWQI